MLCFVLILLSAQAPCPPEAAALIEDAAARAAAFDLAGSADQLAAAARGCPEAHVAALYIRGLVDAQEAFRQGGSPEALIPVRGAIDALARIALNRPGPAEVARLALIAAAAAAQSERDELRLYIDSAVRMESLERAAGQPGAPIVPAVEVAGDLWLQVHHYEEARRWYLEASGQLGMTPRIRTGLARVEALLQRSVQP